MSIPKGWKLVPVEPTSEMIVMGRGYLGSLTNFPGDVYKAMLEAAPTPPDQEGK